MPARILFGHPEPRGATRGAEAIYAIVTDPVMARRGGLEGIPCVMLRRGMRFFAVPHEKHGETWLRLCEQSVSLTFTSISMAGLEVTEFDDIWVQQTWRVQHVPDDVFQVGEKVLVLITEGEHAGGWAPCQIESEGSMPSTFNILVPPIEKPFTNVPPECLRRAADERAGGGEERGRGGPSEAASEDPALPEDLKWFLWYEVWYAGGFAFGSGGGGEARSARLQGAVEDAKRSGRHLSDVQDAKAFSTDALRRLQQEAEAAGKAAAAAALQGQDLRWPPSPKSTSSRASAAGPPPQGVSVDLWAALHAVVGAAGEAVAGSLRGEECSAGESSLRSAFEAAWTRATAASRPLVGASLAQARVLVGLGEEADASVGDLALGRPVEASSAKAPERAARFAVDGDPGTRWTSAYEDNQWLAVDLQDVCSLSRVEIRWEKACAESYSLQGSTDGVAWVNLASSVKGREGWVVTVLPSGSKARWVRVFGRRRATSFGFSIWELRVCGTRGRQSRT
uniref:F5/8 type C domain-containing protein n=1 Tax=Alexandrium monilatum TaxID=311494 RepID=A0A7S4PVD9_9DINO